MPGLYAVETGRRSEGQDERREIDSRTAHPDFPLTPDETRCRFCVYRSLCNRAEQADSLAEWDENAYANNDLSQFTIDIDQIGEIEF